MRRLFVGIHLLALLEPEKLAYHPSRRVFQGTIGRGLGLVKSSRFAVASLIFPRRKKAS